MSELKRNKMEKEKHPQPQFQHLTVPCVQQCGRRNSPLTRFNKFCLVPLSPLSVLRSPSLTGKNKKFIISSLLLDGKVFSGREGSTASQAMVLMYTANIKI
ncbi:hypothetical protein QN277_013773 [Acacia crassicarpa]|uniref:Uncharacterized protein n=1 Tax=Acacia crassicarpa TaxID=499986 RepID=A0AAE1N5E8_9FABA|nr:hypothetical protein QN277_013773 [Acacia crassicarpa]